MSIRAVTKMCKHIGYRLLFKAKKNSPAILMASAGVTGVGCVVAACVATKKLDPVLEQHNNTLAEVKEIIKNEPEHFTEKQGRRMIRRVYESTAVKVAGLYAPAAALGLVAVGCAFGGYKIQANRISALTGALAVAERKLQTYQAKERAEELEKIQDPEEREKILKKAIGKESLKVRWGIGDASFNDPRVWGPYANLHIAQQKEEYLNRVLPVRGAIYYNEMLSVFGKQPNRTPEASVAGWVWDPKGGPHQIDIGLENPQNAGFVSGEDPDGMWLIPNCQSYILDKDLSQLGEMWSFYNSAEGHDRRTAV